MITKIIVNDKTVVEQTQRRYCFKSNIFSRVIYLGETETSKHCQSSSSRKN